jgi:hypothetical protein
MIADERYTTGIRLFQEQHWFESHEVLEHLWRETGRGPTREFLQGLIQLAVSLEHWRRGNPRGSLGQWQKARAKLEPLPAVYHDLALGELLDAFRDTWTRLDLEAAVARAAAGERVHATVERWPTPRWVSAAPGAQGA